MPQSIRRVVTGYDSGGKSVVVSDGEAPSRVTIEHLAGLTMTGLWFLDRPPTDVSQGGDAPSRRGRLGPAPGGMTFGVTEIPPDEAVLASLDMAALQEEVGAKMPGLLDASDPSRLGMHRTETIDFVVVLSGEIWLRLDESEVHLEAGDCVVQRGTWHAWHNRSAKPCLIADVMISSQPA
jgi:mannose-6-phosphate isomerase-like protein (cupin superfamily)